jgi:predicted transposase YdaD
VYKLPRLSREEIQRLLHLPEVKLKQTRFYQDMFAEGRTEGRTEGRMEGRTEGRAEGQQQGEAALVLRQLRRRLGALAADVETQIRALPVADSEALGGGGGRCWTGRPRLNSWRGFSATASHPA